MRKKAIIKSKSFVKIKCPKGDKLKMMMNLQKQFGSKFCDFDNLCSHDKEKWTKEFVVCCMDELSEILNWTNWKHWKTKRTKVDEIELKYEVIDLLHFVMSLMLVWGMTAEDVAGMYVAKNEHNFKRQEDKSLGYV